MLTAYYETDIAPNLLGQKIVGIIGYGNQGHAHALNLRDFGVSVLVGARPHGPSGQAAKDAGFEVLSIAELSRRADIVMLLSPDETHGQTFAHDIAPHLRAGAAVGFAHGFSVHFRQVVPPKNIDVFLAAPKGAGDMLRNEFCKGSGLPCLIAVHQDATGHAKDIALGYAQALGSARAGILETTFRAECETDLFGEQAVLCGGVSALVHAAFETLVEAGYPEELAYFECLHELKFTVDLMHARGIGGMRQRISNTAKFGDVTRGPRIVDARVRETMKALLEEITSGRFAEEWLLECQIHQPVLWALIQKGEAHPIETVGRRLRAMMPWLSNPASTKKA